MEYVEDEDGYLWIGTNKGLFRYNGSVSIPYYADAPGALTSDFILTLCADTDHRLWVGTDSGICLIRNGKVVRTSPYGTDYIFSLYNYSESTLLFSTQDALYTYDKESGVRTPVVREEGYSMPSRLQRAGTSLWVVYPAPVQKVCRYNANFELQQQLSLPAGERVTGIAFWEDTLFLSTTRGFRCFTADGRETEVPPLLQVFAGKHIAFLQYNPHMDALNFGICGEGLWLFSEKGKSLDHLWPEEKLEGHAYNVVTGRSVLWLYQWEGDLTALYGIESRSSLSIPGIGWGEVLLSILPGPSADEAVLVTTSCLYLFNTASNEFKSFHLPSGHAIRSAVRTHSGDYVVLDKSSEICHLRLEGNRWTQIACYRTDFPSTDIWEDYEGNICTTRGELLYWISSDGKQGYKNLGMQVDGIASTGQDGRIYLTGPVGVFQMDLGHKFVRLPVNIPSPTCCLQGKDGTYYIGTAADGLFLFKSSDRSLRQISTGNGLPDRTIRGLVEDSSGNIWISTRNYIACLSRGSLRISVKDYSTQYPKNYSRLCALPLVDSSEGELILFGSDQSLSLVYPTLKGESSVIPLTLDAVLVNNSPVDLASATPLTLRHDQNQLVFFYSGMDFQRSSQLNYAYFLEGYDKTWLNVGRNLDAMYANLPAGKYTFRVRVYAPDGTLSPSEIAFPFRIKPAPWFSWPAILAYALLVFMLLGALIKYYLYYLRSREMALLAEADKALAESEHLIEEEHIRKPLTGQDKEFIGKMEKMVRDHLSEETFNATVLSEQLGMSYTRFYVKVKELLGVTPQEYLTEARLSLAKQLLESGDYNVSEVCYQVGFTSLPGFSRSYKKRFGTPPSEHLPK